MSGSPEPGVQVATGDPGQLQDAAAWHTSLANGLEAHAATVSHAAGGLASAWNGEAAASYQQLSTIVAAHFRAGADRARTAAVTLRRFASELERCQREGRAALRQAEHWVQEIGRDEAKLRTAQTAVTNARNAVTRAQHDLTVAAGAGAAAGKLTAAAGRELTAARHQLTQAQAQERAAQRALTDARNQLTHWQAVGARAWHEAQTAAERASGSLAPLSVPPPPLAGAPAAPGGPFAEAAPLAAGGLPWEVGAGATVIGYGADGVEGAAKGVSGLASWAGRTLRTGATAEERSAAAPILREAGSLGKDLEPWAKVAGPVGTAVGFGAGVAGGESPVRAGLETAGSVAGGTVAGGAVGGLREAGTLGLGTPGCVVAGAGAAAAGSWIGEKVGSGIDDLINDL